jgi:serpin B
LTGTHPAIKIIAEILEIWRRGMTPQSARANGMKNTNAAGNGHHRTEPTLRASTAPHHRARHLKSSLFAILACILLLTPLAVKAQVQSIVTSNTAFALDLYGQLATNEGNLFFSPYSISTCLAMLYAGAAGDTEAQMSRVLGFETNQPKFASLFGQLQSELEAKQQTNVIELNIANALWTQVGFPFLPSFLETATNQYQANVNQANFVTKGAAATAEINDWVAQETQNKIQNILPPGNINAYTRLVLANAIYFLGVWTYAFAETNTSTQPFYLSGTSQEAVPLMYQPVPTASNGLSRLSLPVPGTPMFNYMETNGFQAIQLNYASNALFSMVILLPSQIDGWGQLEQQLSPAFLSNVLAQMSPQYVKIYLPRFTLESYFSLTGTLAGMGMPDAFTPDVADFSGVDGMEDLYITFIYHKAWGQVNEAGTQAAAATVVGVGTAVVGGPIEPPTIYVFRADHPFLFFIRDNQTGSLLFLGRLSDPGQSPATPVPTPQLAIAPSGNNLKLSWPYPSTGWTLQQTSDLTSTNWTPTGGVSNDGTNNFFTITPSSGNMFFLLRQ